MRSGRQPFPELETPALLIDESRLSDNLADVQALAKQSGRALRPHIKSHKSVYLAKRQLELGATGVAVAKLSEAVVMAAAGIHDIQIANQIIGTSRIRTLVELSYLARVSCAIDHLDNAQELSDAFHERGLRLPVLVEVDTGLNRCGVRGQEELETLYREVLQLPGVEVIGIMTHAGHAYAAQSREEVARIGKREGRTMGEMAIQLRKLGFPVDVVSVGSTPTARFAAIQEGVTELRVGNYLFNDRIQVALGTVGLDRCALGVLATIISRTRDQAVCDAGSKALTTEAGAHGSNLVQGHGVIEGMSLTVTRLSEEHGIIADAEQRLSIGRRVRLIPNHACPVVNLFDRAYLVDGEKILEEIIIDARGCSQ
ncbi:MAG: alanine racemase [Candidatus Zixiibacteriota bacterium]